MNKDTIIIDKLYNDFTFNLNSVGLSLEGSDRVVFRRGLQNLLETYPSNILITSIENFFIDTYAKNANFPFRLFLKQIVRYTKTPSIYQIDISTLINKHFKSKHTGLVYEEITYAEDDKEREIIKRVENNDLGTIFDVSLEDLEKILAKRTYTQGKDAVPSSWTDAYFNRVKIYTNPTLYEKELKLAKEQKLLKTSLEKENKKRETLLVNLREFIVLYKEIPSKKLKYQYLDTKFKNCDEVFKEKIRCCKTVEDFKKLQTELLKGERV